MSLYLKYQRQQLMLGDKPVEPAQYRKGFLIGEFEYDSQEECEKQEQDQD